MRRIWIWILAGAALILGCVYVLLKTMRTTSPPCYYGPPPIDKTQNEPQDDSCQILQRPKDSIRYTMEERPPSVPVYSAPKVDRELESQADNTIENSTE